MTSPIIPDYPRDLIGYGRQVPHARWPGEARIALNFVVNYEEGGERTILDGDGVSECYLVPDFPAACQQHNLTVASVFFVKHGSSASHLEHLTLEMPAYGRQSLPALISWQGFS